MLKKHLYLLLLSSIFAAPCVWSQANQFMVWSLEEGLPQSQVYALCQDRKGYLWIGTQGGGACRFDGATFEVFSEAQGLKGNFVNVLFKDQNDIIWAGTNEGLSFFNEKGFQSVEGTAGLVIQAIVQADSARLLLGTQRGVWEYHKNTKTCTPSALAPTLDGLQILSLAVDAQQGLWVGSQRGLWHKKAGQQAVFLHTALKLPANPVNAFALTDRHIWFSILGAGVAALDIQTQELQSFKRLPGLDRVVSLLANADGTLWAGTQSQGLYRFSAQRDSILQSQTESEGLPHNHVRALLRDADGRLWIGTSGGGLALAGNQAFRRYNRADGLPGNRIYALCEDTSGRLWMTASQNGLAVLDAAGLRSVAADSGYLQKVKSRTLAFDASGNLWVGTEGKGVLVIKPGGLHIFRRENGFLPSDWVQKIIRDPQGTMWIGTAEGLVRVTQSADGQYQQKWYTGREGMPGAAISALQCDRQGNVWFGTLTGKIGYLRQGKVGAVFDTTQGLPGAMVTALAFDADNRCWAGTKGSGIFAGGSTDGGSFSAILPEKIASKNIYLLLFDASGALWAGTENGVDRVVFDKKMAATVAHFGKNEGFTGIETCQDAAWCDQRGQLWFGTMNGLMRYMAQGTVRSHPAPRLHFEAISLFYKPVQETEFAATFSDFFNGRLGGLALPWHQNHLSFAFKAIDLLHPEALRYRWKLEGPDADWSPWSAQQQVNYANLAPGVYRLLVQAASDGENLSAPLSAAFTIRKPFWEEWYFRAGAFVLLLAAGAWLARMYIGRVRRKEAVQREKLEVQNRLLQLEQKALQLQMNPHFIFNALNSIQALVATQDYAIARQEIGNFAKLMRNVLYNSRKSHITLREETETLEMYLRIEQFCQQNPFTFAVHIAPETDPDSVELPPMLLQPFVENAVIHGVAHLPYPGHIDLHFSLQQEQLHCVVRDNGVGREKAAMLQASKQSGHQSTALLVTQERIAALGGYLVLKDVCLADGSIGGTEVAVMVPVSVAF